jgi:hypothetical protein
MSEQIEMALRKSLNEVDKIRRWQIVGIGIFLLLLLIQAGSVIATLHTVGPKVGDAERRTLIADVFFMAYTVGFCTLGICLFITRMTLKILKAIELLSKP